MFKKIETFLKSLSYDTNTIKVYVVLALINLVVVVIMGIVYGVNLYNTKTVYYASLEAQRNEMSQKLDQLKALKSSYDTANLFVESFNKVMPTELDFENYIVPFTNTLAQNGFLVTGINHSSGNVVGTAVVSAAVEGDYFNVPKMLEAIESMPRITDVQGINISVNSLSMPLTMRVYYVSAPKFQEVKK